MKKIIFPIVVLTLVGFGVITSGLSNEDRERTLAELNKTQERFMSVVGGLSEAQLNFKPTPESWSVAECVEHLAISEGMIGGMLQGALETPADPSMRDSVQISDDKLLAMISSREKKVKTGEAFEPSGKFGSHLETVNAFLDKRGEHIEYVKTTNDDLRNHYGKLPFGTVDGVQILLFMSGHTERHVTQMEEVIAHENYPKTMSAKKPQ
ncbi:MAG: DinB family protein [Maribacter sp.]|nr:DinB family protein [Maribacter sp.]MBT8313224.1 DinB family protein [Maribacter sp.]